MSHTDARLVFGALTTIDLVHFADELPSLGEKATADMSYVDVGGPAANAAITAAMLGSDSALHTVIGSGPMAAFAERVLQDHGVVTVDHAPHVDLPMASIWVEGSGERTILSTDNKRSQVVAQADLVPLGGATAVLLDGHYPELQLVIGKGAVAQGVPVVLDCGRWRPVYAELLPLASDIIMTASFRPPDLRGLSARDAMQAVYDKHHPRLCAVSRGPDSILLVDNAGCRELSVPSVDAIDTMGAGDVLHGAYVHYRYTEQMDGGEALQAAAGVASHSCRARGARSIANPEQRQ